MKKKRINLFSLLFDIIIDLLLIGLGVVLYFQFFVYQIFPISISPALTDPVGGFTNAAYIICGIPFMVGLVSLVRTIFRTFKKLLAR